jgi:N-acetyl sugar amidotransferase
MDTSDPEIRFDERGYCDHCVHFYRVILPGWHTDERGEQALADMVDRIRKGAQGRAHDCLLGISGGVDSSFLAWKAREKLGLNPLLLHVDTGWNSPQAVNNIERLVDALSLDLHTEVVEWQEMRDFQLSFLRAGLPYADHAQDIAIFSALFTYAATHDFRYILTAANHSTECVRQPLEWAYWGMDLAHINDIHGRFGTRPLRSFPISSIFKNRIYYRYVKGIRVEKPLNHMRYVRAEAVRDLGDRFGWQAYSHKHHESRATRFIESYWMPKKFGYDNRRAHYSSLILSEQMTRDEALAQLAESAYDEQELALDLEYFATKLGITTDEFHRLMAAPNRSYRDYKNRKWLIDLGQRALSITGEQQIRIR